MQRQTEYITHRTPSGRSLWVEATTRKWRIDSNKFSLISSQSDQVQAWKCIHLMSNFIKNNSIISMLTEMPRIVHNLIKQFFESTTRSWNAEPLLRPENAGISTRKCSTLKISTRSCDTRPENQKLSLSSECRNFVISSPISKIFFLNIIYSSQGIFLAGFW